MNLKGTLPVLILQVLSTGDKHGYAIAQEIKARSEGTLDFQEGSLYPALHAQEQKGLIESCETHGDGRRRRSYRLTRMGIEHLESARDEWKLIAGAVSHILGTT
jgi:DNA-binding PadR family transcriptional regulator